MGHVLQFSIWSQRPLPHVPQALLRQTAGAGHLQSSAQVPQFSSLSQRPLPQVRQEFSWQVAGASHVQSAGQEPQFSSGSHLLLPHLTQFPAAHASELGQRQSSGELLHVSPVSQSPFLGAGAANVPQHSIQAKARWLGDSLQPPVDGQWEIGQSPMSTAETAMSDPSQPVMLCALVPLGQTLESDVGPWHAVTSSHVQVDMARSTVVLEASAAIATDPSTGDRRG